MANKASIPQLPEGIHLSNNGPAIINDDWAIRLPDQWVWSVDPEVTGDRPMVSLALSEYKKYGQLSPYGDNCFTVFRVGYAAQTHVLSMLMGNATTVISRPDLQVFYNCNHSEHTTYCQYVTVNTRKAGYTIQFFYTNSRMKEQGRIHKIEEVLRTICLASEVESPKNGPGSAKPASNTNMPELHYRKNFSFLLGDNLQIPIPDGYHYRVRGTGVNDKWAYAVPMEVSLEDNHIDAKPFSFGVTTNPVSHLSFEAEKIEAVKQAMMMQGILDDNVDSMVISPHCGLLYQSWYDENDETYNKIDGFLLCGNDIYQFHIYANHSAKIGRFPNTMNNFLNRAIAWMQRVKWLGDYHMDDEPVVIATPLDEDPFAPPGVDFLLDEDDETRLEKYHGSAKDVVIPEGIEVICEHAFMMQEITSVVMPETVAELEGCAFWGCKQLKSVQLPSSLEKIGEDAFYSCESLTSIVIHEGVTEIGGDVFSFCRKLKDIYVPASLWEIGDNAFNTLCSETVLHVIPGSDAETYARENNLKFDHQQPPTASAPEPEAIPAKSAKSTPKSKASKAPPAQEPEATPTEAPKEAKPPKASSKTYVVEGNKLVKYTGKAATPTVPKEVTVIGAGAFDHLGKMQTLELPDSVTQVEAGAFSYCPSLSRVVIPHTVENIAKGAFFECPNVYIDTMQGSYAAKYGKENGIKVKIDGLYSQRPEIAKKLEEIRQAAAEQARLREEEAERRRKEAAEQRRLENEERVRREAEEARRQRQAVEDARQQRQARLEALRNRYDQLVQQIQEQEQIILNNKGWFGAKARARKAAQARLASLQETIAREYPFGKP